MKKDPADYKQMEVYDQRGVKPSWLDKTISTLLQIPVTPASAPRPESDSFPILEALAQALMPKTRPDANGDTPIQVRSFHKPEYTAVVPKGGKAIPK